MKTPQRRLVVLGSTGSVGSQALEIVRSCPGSFSVLALAAHSNIQKLIAQVEEFRPRFVGVCDPASASTLRSKLGGDLNVQVLSGDAGIEELATLEAADFVLAAIAGTAGLRSTMAAVQAGKTIGLANKESLVLAGELLVNQARHKGARVIPVDSEHSALLQLLCDGSDAADTTSNAGLWTSFEQSKVRRLILTASGGPFRTLSKEALKTVTPAQALKHPIWAMGPKISIDSATLMNKTMEVIEASWLFGLPARRIDIVVHPQSIVHSLVQFVDGSYKAQLDRPDMRGPLAYAMAYPDRMTWERETEKDITELGSLAFEQVDTDRFPAATFGRMALDKGGTTPAALAGADEAAISAFLDGRCRFSEISELCNAVMSAHRPFAPSWIDDVLAATEWGKQEVNRLIGSAQPVEHALVPQAPGLTFQHCVRSQVR